jgi:hypothetical protein
MIKWLRVMAWGLGGLSVIYVAAGLAALAWDIGGSFPVDLRLRWTETQLLLAGINPQLAGHPDPALSGTHDAMKALGGSYPPWAYAAGLLLAPPLSWEWTRWYATLVNALALGVLAWWVYQQARHLGQTTAWAAVAAALAMFPIAICLSFGQYSVIVTACLALVERLVAEKTPLRGIAAGLLLGLACVKPQLAGLFVLAMIVERQWLTVGACLAYLAVASSATWWLAGSDPATMFLTSLREASAFAFLSHNVLVHWLGGLMPFHAATTTLAFAGASAALMLLVAARHRPVLTRWSICAIVAMFWGYRKHYDIALLVFPLTLLLVTAAEARKPGPWLVYGVFGLTLWLPIRDAQWNSTLVETGDLIIWIIGLAFLNFCTWVRIETRIPRDPQRY